MIDNYCIKHRADILRKNAAARWNLEEKDCHIGHIALQAMLQEPESINQIDGATDEQETNLSVATRSTRLASALTNYGLKPGDTVIVMGINHLNLCIPYFACHFSGFSMCAVDPASAGDLKKLWPYVHPKIIFCQKSCEEKIKEGFETNGEKCEIVIFDSEENNIEEFTKKYNGTDVDFRPAVIDQSKIPAWLMLTSGTTGLPKVAIIPFDTLLNAIICWWLPFPERIPTTLVMGTLQWMSGLIFYISGPLKGYTRLQSSAPRSPHVLVGLINKYKPAATAWAAYLLGKFLEVAETVCDISSFKYIVIGGSAIEKSLLDRLRKHCNARVCLVYGMTELLVPVFDFNEKTPYGASGKPFLDKYQYKLVDSDGQIMDKPNQTGELWIKGDAFFKGYKNNPEETNIILTKDGWFRTGDIFYKDGEDYYFFVERKKLLIKHYGFQLSPLQMEEVLKRHPNVAEACVVGKPVPDGVELPVAAIQNKNGLKADPKELFELIDNNIAEGRQLSTGFFFVDSFPITPSGKINRSKIKELAITSPLNIYTRNLITGTPVNDEGKKMNHDIKPELEISSSNASCCSTCVIL